MVFSLLFIFLIVSFVGIIVSSNCGLFLVFLMCVSIFVVGSWVLHHAEGPRLYGNLSDSWFLPVY